MVWRSCQGGDPQRGHGEGMAELEVLKDGEMLTGCRGSDDEGGRSGSGKGMT